MGGRNNGLEATKWNKEDTCPTPRPSSTRAVGGETAWKLLPKRPVSLRECQILVKERRCREHSEQRVEGIFLVMYYEVRGNHERFAGLGKDGRRRGAKKGMAFCEMLCVWIHMCCICMQYVQMSMSNMLPM